MLRLLLSTHRTLCLYIFGLMCLYIHQIALVGPSASEHRIDDMWSLQSKARLYCLYLGLAPIVVMYTFFPSAWRNRRRRLIVLAILCPVVVVAALDYFSLWCAYREYERKMLCDFAVEWSDKFGQTNITHWLGLGTYLPIARTQDDTHRMIACEHDFDFFIDPKHHATVLLRAVMRRPHLQAFGYSRPARGGTRVMPGSCSSTCTSLRRRKVCRH
eukprot:PhM_4_TR7749/c0_g1_i1/m.41806